MNERFAAVYAEEWPRCVAILTRVLGDLERAEDAVQDAFTIALERWPTSGVPDSPGSWIVTTARNRACQEGDVIAAARLILQMGVDRFAGFGSSVSFIFSLHRADMPSAHQQHHGLQ